MISMSGESKVFLDRFPNNREYVLRSYLDVKSEILFKILRYTKKGKCVGVVKAKIILEDGRVCDDYYTSELIVLSGYTRPDVINSSVKDLILNKDEARDYIMIKRL